MNKVHELKCWPIYFDGIINGYKTFDVRYNDREYGYGDILRLREYDGDKEVYTGREMTMKVRHIHLGLGVKPGWVIMAIVPIDNT